MKKLLKISVLVGILMFALTMICYAEEPTDTTTTSGETLPQTDNDESSNSDTSTTDNITAEFEVTSNIVMPLVVKGLPVGDTISYYYTVDTNKTTAFDSKFPKLSRQQDGTYETIKNEHNLIQLNGDLYIHIYSADDAHTTLADIKLDKPISNAYNQFDDTALASYQTFQVIFYLPYSLNTEEMPRKIHYKIGKITDNSILLAIKNNEADALGKLKDFAKNDTAALTEETVNPNRF